ncbi:hypothetical protein LXA43DRAFT_1068051 [Ganoderma leucocontextum]|nr:hypothetical protein LXA43DRAFT_1068051 [Ganoderma leucocontextum]
MTVVSTTANDSGEGGEGETWQTCYPWASFGSMSLVSSHLGRHNFAPNGRSDSVAIRYSAGKLLVPSKQLLTLAVSGEVGQDRVLHVPVQPATLALSLSPVQRVLSMDEMVWTIGEALLSTYTPVPSIYPRGTRKQLLSLALTCKAWLDIGLGLLWRNFEDLPLLVDMLIPDHLRADCTDAGYRYCVLQSLYWSESGTGSIQPLFLRMRYYAGWIRNLRISSVALDRRIIEPLSQLCGRVSLFPVLRSILWVVERELPSPASLSTFVAACRAPQVTKLALNVSFQPQELEDQRMLSNSILQALRQTADSAAITSLTIIGSLSFSLPMSALRGFATLKSANVQVNLMPDMNQGVWPDTMDTLFIRWTVHTNFSSLASTIKFSNLSSLLQQISSFRGACQFLSLTRLVIFAGTTDYLIYRTFPQYMPIRPHFVVGSFWSDVESLVKMMRRLKVYQNQNLEVHDWRMGLGDICQQWLFTSLPLLLGPIGQ